MTKKLLCATQRILALNARFANDGIAAIRVKLAAKAFFRSRINNNFSGAWKLIMACLIRIEGKEIDVDTVLPRLAAQSPPLRYAVVRRGEAYRREIGRAHV